MYQFGDCLAAYEELTDCIAQAQSRPPVETKFWIPVHFIRGYFNSRLGDFSEATSDFVQAHSQMERTGIHTTTVPRIRTTPPGDVELPVPEVVTHNDVLNAAGHATFLLATQGNKSDSQRAAHLDDAAAFFYRALSMSGSTVGIVAFNLAQALYFRSVYGSQAEESSLLTSVVKFYDMALSSPGFPVPADALVMKSKALARLGRKDQARADLARALELDPDQRQVNFESQAELRAPPVPPQDVMVGLKKGHVFVQQHFSRPTWCDFCTHFLSSMIGKQGYRCSNCGYTVHTACFNKVRMRLCLLSKPLPNRESLKTSSDEEISTPTSHIHRL